MRKQHALSALGVVVAAVLAAGTTDESGTSGSGGGGSPSAGSSTVDLKAGVSFTGTQFVIANRDSFNWTNVKLEVNSGLVSSGFILRVGVMEAGQTYTVGAAQFAKPDGKRFNPFEYKPQSLSIWCDTPRGDGFYYGTWK